MKKSLFLAAYAVVFTALSLSVKAQSIVDPGISVYNYKHPNKAAQAKKAKQMTTIRVESYNTVERHGKYQQNRYASSTPKYAPRPASLVLAREYKVEKIDINPLLSPRNYKTPTLNITKDTTRVADSYNKSSAYPTTD